MEIRKAIESIINEKKTQHRAPYCATMLEVMKLTKADAESIKQTMRQMHLDGGYKAHISINKIPMIHEV